jgi:L-2,4-diaminobutyric acid acetyltransferase
VGWISGYRPPSDVDAFFVWQVAVHESARGLGLGRRMLEHLLARPSAGGATRLLTTITEDNDASWGLFGSFARHRGARIHKAPFFERDAHFAGAHDTEILVTIEPLAAPAAQTNKADKAEMEAV